MPVTGTIDLFHPPSAAPARRRPMTAAQRAMASKPSAAVLRRSAEASIPQQVRKHREFEHRGWEIAVFDSPYAAGVLLVTAARPSASPDGPARVVLTEEVADQAAADVWIAHLIPAGGVLSLMQATA